MKADADTGKDIAKYLGIRRATLYRYITEDTAA
jgi:predicted DNA-binding transcriptional regulator AlpA